MPALKSCLQVISLALLILGASCKTVTYPTSATFSKNSLVIEFKRGQNSWPVTSVLAVDTSPKEPHFVTVTLEKGQVFATDSSGGSLLLATPIGEAHEVSHERTLFKEIMSFSFVPHLKVVKPKAVMVVYQTTKKVAFVYWMPVS